MFNLNVKLQLIAHSLRVFKVGEVLKSDNNLLKINLFGELVNGCSEMTYIENVEKFEWKRSECSVQVG